MDAYREAAWEMLSQIGRVILGKEKTVFEAVAAILADGHILLEDVPGVGKTTLALAISKIMDLQWNRVQFTPDVLPSDLTGFSLYRKDREEFVYQPGAVFCNLLLADEINRTSPKTQSALLEVMEERQVTVDGVSRKIPEPFYVIATQNPSGTVGTQMLPLAQMDRFMISLSMGYPDLASEIAIAKEVDAGKRAENVQPLIDRVTFAAMQEAVKQVFIHDSVYQYIVRLIAATRDDPYLESGASPRGTMALVKISRAAAWMQENDFVSPSDVAGQFLAATKHRVQLNTKARAEKRTKEEVLNKIVEETEKPVLRRK
jgi:MoxR-like ATPase